MPLIYIQVRAPKIDADEKKFFDAVFSPAPMNASVQRINGRRQNPANAPT